MIPDMRRARVSAQNASYNRYIEVWIRQERGDKLFVVKPVEIEMVEVDQHSYAEPALRFDRDSAQELVDSLWQCGIRPTEGSGSAGSLMATERHLEDMRSLVFKTNKPAK